jgi:predicted transcriptional regulator
MAEKPLHEKLSRRQHQVMDAVFALGEATVREVVDRIGEPEAYDSIRVIMANLAKEGLLEREREGRRYRYRPGLPEAEVRRSEIRHLMRTFFEGTPSRAILAFLEVGLMDDELTPEELDRISAWIEDRADEREDG